MPASWVPATVTFTVCAPATRTAERYTSTLLQRRRGYWSMVVGVAPFYLGPTPAHGEALWRRSSDSCAAPESERVAAARARGEVYRHRDTWSPPSTSTTCLRIGTFLGSVPATASFTVFVAGRNEATKADAVVGVWIVCDRAPPSLGRRAEHLTDLVRGPRHSGPIPPTTSTSSAS